MFSLGVAGLVACDPLVPLGESSGDSESSTSSAGSSGFGEPSNPTGSVPPNPSTTSPIGCAPGTYTECTCPGGGYGEQVCSSQGEFGACECYGDDITWGTSSGGWWGSSGSSGWWGSSSSGSSGGWNEPGIPQLPPGEVCLPLDMPCVGSFDIWENEALEPIGICSRIEGDLFIQAVTTLEALDCLRVVNGFAGISQTDLPNLTGLEGLQFADGFGVAENPQLTTVSLPALESVGNFIVAEHATLTSFDLPVFDEIIGNMDVFNNAMLPNCEIEALVAQTNPPGVSCEGNLSDMCVKLCD